MSRREPIGEIECPWCKRTAELHASTERTKLDPENGGGKQSYPKKFFVICPPTTGYRGCGTTLANSAQAQERMMENGHIFGAGPREPREKKPAAAVAAASEPAAPAAAAAPQPSTSKPSAKKNPFSLVW